MKIWKYFLWKHPLVRFCWCWSFLWHEELFKPLIWKHPIVRFCWCWNFLWHEELLKNFKWKYLLLQSCWCLNDTKNCSNPWKANIDMTGKCIRLELIDKHRKNCEWCPGHYLSTSVYWCLLVSTSVY